MSHVPALSLTSVASLETSADAARSALSVRVHASFAELADLRTEWEQLVDAVDGEIYMTPDWLESWWAVYAGRRSLAVFVCRAHGRLVGVVPMLIDRVHIGPTALRVARVLGSDYGLLVCQPPVLAEHSPAVFTAVLDGLLGHDLADVASFTAVGESWAALPGLRDAATAPSAPWELLNDEPRGPFTTFHLPATFDEYLGTLSKNHRQNYRRTINLIRRHGALRWDLTPPDAAEAEFERFRVQHETQWARDGKLGHFGDWPRALEFHTALVRRNAPLGRLRLVRLLLDDEPIAYNYAYRLGAAYHWLLPSRRVGEEYDRMGLGRVGVMTMIEAAIAEGARRVEAGPAHYDYKVQLGGTEIPRRALLIAARRRGVRARVQRFALAARCLDVAYNKFWYRRVAPRIRWGRGSLWDWWIRSRI